LYFQLDQRTEFLQEIQKAEALNPRSPLRLGSIGFFLALSGDWERGKHLLDKAMKMNNIYPAWYHGVTCSFYYRQGKYDEAYAQAVQYDLPGFFWAPLLRGACLGQLQRRREAEAQIAHLLELKPDFPQKAWHLIQHYIKEDTLIDHVMEGLRKAGLGKIPGNK
jgi:tetratricopeptide (TPR) repeat protein